MKNALIWGANGGIGRAITQKLITDSWNVLTISRQDEEIDPIAPHLQLSDITDPFALQRVAMEVGMQSDPINLWIYAIGDIAAVPIAELSLDGWNQIIQANLSGPFLATKYSLPTLAPDAHLIFVGAVSERLRLPGLSAYAAAKAGLEAFAETLKKEQRKLRVTVVRPGAVVTPFWEKVPLKLPKDAMTPEKVAEKILDAYDNKHKGHLDLTH